MMIKRNIFAILTALAATTLLATGCGGDVECGKGTSEKDGKCVATDASAETCGAGTVLADGKCVLDNSGCGAGTALVDGACVPSADSCGDGTTLDTATGQCVSNSNIECGAGTVDVDGKCQPAADNCTAGTKLEGGKCVIDPTACGTGTALDANTGICSPAAEACGVGLGFTDGKCVPTEELCDAGTIFSEDTGLCLPEATCKIGDEIVEGICLSPAEALFKHPDAKSIDGEPTLDMPAVDERLIFTGTIAKPVEEADGSFTNNVDKFTFVGEAGQYVKLTLQALGAVDLVFEVEGPEGINARNYVRTSSVGVEVVPARYVYIPYDGEYTVTVQPALGWLLDLNADGGEGFEFAGTLEQLEAPTATNITVDKETPAQFAGNSRALLSNLYKFDGATEGDLVTFTLNDFGVDAASSIFVLDNATPPAVIAEFNNINAGGSFKVAGTTEGFQILVDNNLVGGLKTQFDISGLINGTIEDLILDDGEIKTLTGTAAPNTIIKISYDGTAGEELDIAIYDANGDLLGNDDYIEAGDSHYQFYSAGGDFTVDVENYINDQAINARVSIELIKPLDLGVVGTDEVKTHHVASHNIGQEIFLLIDSVQSQILDISYETGVDYTSQQALLDDLLFGDIWTEDGSKLRTHVNVYNLLIPGSKTTTLTGQGQYIAIRLAHVPAGYISAGGSESNVPYNRVGYDIVFNSYTDTRFTEAQEIPTPLPATVTGNANEAEDGVHEYWKIKLAADTNVKMSGKVTGGEGCMLYRIIAEDESTRLLQVGNFCGSNTSTYIFEAGKTYYIAVGGGNATWIQYGFDDDYTYELTLEAIAPPVVVPELASNGTNISEAAAQAITQIPVKLTGHADEADDSVGGVNHFWKYTPAANVQVKLTGIIKNYQADDASMTVALFEDYVDVINFDTVIGGENIWPGGGDPTSLTFTADLEAGKTYFIYVGGIEDEHFGEFDYEVTLEEI